MTILRGNLDKAPSKLFFWLLLYFLFANSFLEVFFFSTRSLVDLWLRFEIFRDMNDADGDKTTTAVGFGKVFSDTFYIQIDFTGRVNFG